MDIKSLIDEYINFLKKGISCREIEKGYEITTPFLDDNNDCIQIYVQDIQDDRILLSDGGMTISGLEDRGVKLTNSREELLHSIIRSYGVELRGESNLVINTSIKDFAQKKHALLQAILKIGDICFTAQTRVASIFAEDIAEFFEQNQIFSMKNMSVRGRTGFVQTYDFVLARDLHFPERFCSAINKPTRSTITNAIFGWNDTFPQRDKDSKCLVFMNDENKFSSLLIDALREYNIIPILKSQMRNGDCLSEFKIVS